MNNIKDKKQLITVLERMGYILETDMRALLVESPNLQVAIKWSDGSRVLARIREVREKMRVSPLAAREVFVPSGTYQTLVESLKREGVEIKPMY